MGLGTPYSEGLKHRMLRYQRCAHCATAQTLAHHACVNCGRASLEWQQSSGRGEVYAVTAVRRAPSEEFRALVPYTLALVHLDEGPRVMAHAAAGVAIGQRVRASFFEHGPRVLLSFLPD